MLRSLIFHSCFILIFAFFSINALGQDRITETIKIKVPAGQKILVDVGDHDDDDFLAPYINDQLSAMRDSGYQNIKMFQSVVSLNLILNAYSESERYRIKSEMFDKTDHSGQNIKPSKQMLENDKAVLDRLKDVQYLLKVRITPFNGSQGTQGIQLILYKMTDGGPFGQLKNLNFSELRYTSFTINPNTREYRNVIRVNLHRLVYEANKRPYIVIMRNGQYLTDSLLVPNGTIHLDAGLYAPDLLPEDFTFTWDINCLSCGVYYPETHAPSLQFTTDTNRQYLITVTAADTHDTISTSCRIISTYSSLLELYLRRGDDFSKSRIVLYSYGKKFAPNNFASLFNLFLPSSGRRKIDEEGNWVQLTGDIQMLSSMPYISFTASVTQGTRTQLSNAEDAPIIHKFDHLQPQVLPVTFILRQDSERRVSVRPPLYYYNYSLFGQIDTLKNITVPSTIHFVAKASDYNDSTFYNFDVQLRKKSRLSLFLNFSAVSKDYLSLALAGVGADYLLLKGLSLEGSFGTATTRSFSSPIRLYGKLNANLHLLNIGNPIELDFTYANLYRETYNFPLKGPITDGGYHVRTGFGGVLRFFPSDAKYFPFSLDVFYNYYPIGYDVFNFPEIGLRASFYFAK